VKEKSMELFGLPLTSSIGYILVLIGTIMAASGTRKAMKSHVSEEGVLTRTNTEQEAKKTRGVVEAETKKLGDQKLPLLKDFLVTNLRPQIDKVNESWNDLNFITMRFKYNKSENIEAIQKEFNESHKQLYDNHQPLNSMIKSVRTIIGDIRLKENSQFLPLNNYLDDVTNPSIQMLIQVGTHAKNGKGQPIILTHNILVESAQKNDRSKIPDIVLRWKNNMKEQVDKFDKIYQEILVMEN